jgi:hypothetical protein
MTDLLECLHLGNISDFKDKIQKMDTTQLAKWFFWLYFEASDTFGEILVARAFLHTKRATESDYVRTTPRGRTPQRRKSV